MEMSDFDKLVDEVANEMWARYAIEDLYTRTYYVNRINLEYAIKDAISELQKRQEAVAWMDDGSTGGYGQPSHRVITNDTKSKMPKSTMECFVYPLFRFPPSCDAKVTELEEEIEFLKAVATGNKLLADMYASKLNGR
jgi:hypothetical protein